MERRIYYFFLNAELRKKKKRLPKYFQLAFSYLLPIPGVLPFKTKKQNKQTNKNFEMTTLTLASETKVMVRGPSVT